MKSISELVELLKTKDLTPLEQGDIFKKLETLGLSRKEIAQEIDKHEAHVSNMILLSNAPKTVFEFKNGESIMIGQPEKGRSLIGEEVERIIKVGKITSLDLAKEQAYKNLGIAPDTNH